jgi:hypothetical protein
MDYCIIPFYFFFLHIAINSPIGKYILDNSTVLPSSRSHFILLFPNNARWNIASKYAAVVYLNDNYHPRHNMAHNILQSSPQTKYKPCYAYPDNGNMDISRMATHETKNRQFALRLLYPAHSSFASMSLLNPDKNPVPLHMLETPTIKSLI